MEDILKVIDEIGTDYEIVKASQKGVTIKCPVGKKGRTFNATFNVVTVEEIAPAKP